MLLKHLHLTFVALSMLIFIVRGVWLFTQSSMLASRFSKIAPHAINGIMLITGIALAATVGLSPSDHPWLLAKIIGIVIFIALGVAAFKVKQPLVQKALWIDALIVFIYIASVATTKNPWGFLAGFIG
jgi:uncharacterized membrane protein SirB2